MKRFLEGKPDFPKSGKSGYVHPTKVRDMLERSVYARCLEAPNWGVTLCKGHHEADCVEKLFLDCAVID